MDEKDKSQNQRRWVREEVVILVSEYFRTKRFSAQDIDENCRRISDFLRNREMQIVQARISDVFRDYAGIRMQLNRIKCLDPDTPYNGMQGTKLQKEVVDEYLRDADAIKKEAEMIYKKYTK